MHVVRGCDTGVVRTRPAPTRSFDPCSLADVSLGAPGFGVYVKDM
jgi:hypothetical protein